MRFQRHLKIAILPIILFILSVTPSFADEIRPASRSGNLEPLLAPTRQLSKLEARRNLIVRAVQRVKDAVVNIHSERTVQRQSSDLFSLAPQQNRVNGMGTGIIIDPRGYIVTNQHVVENVNIIRIRLSDGTSTQASVVSRSPEVDLALLKIETDRALPTIPLGTSKDLMVGEDVIAIGNAYGYEHTVSRGIVSATKRDVRLNKNIAYRSLIQTDACINPGNSGGPLVNIHGELVGVNVAIRAGAQGIGFAIPVDHMIQVVSQMLRSRRLQAAMDGMKVRDQIHHTKKGAIRTVILEFVEPGSPAAEAGLKIGDELVRVASVPVNCSYDVDRALLGRRAGDRVGILVRRNDKHFPFNLVLKKNSGSAGASELVWRKLGLQLAPVSKELVSQSNNQLNGGMKVISVMPNGIAGQAGIREGDILVGLHQWETLTMDNISFVLLHPDLASFNPLSFYIIRDGQVRRGWLQQVK